MYDDFKVKKNIHSNCLIEIKYEQVNIIINERKKINRQYKISSIQVQRYNYITGISFMWVYLLSHSKSDNNPNYL